MITKFSKGITADARKIRETVFIAEQGFKDEFDELDNDVDTIVIYTDDNLPMATGRLYEEDTKNHYFKLGRIAVYKEYRHLGIGSLIVKTMEDKAISLGATRLLISAQVVAVPFYEKCGYESYGSTYMEEHVEHIAMKKDVTLRK